MYVVIDSRFGPVFATNTMEKAVAQLVREITAHVEQDTLVNPASFRIQRTNGPEPEKDQP